jgi:hypothetical protein
VQRNSSRPALAMILAAGVAATTIGCNATVGTTDDGAGGSNGNGAATGSGGATGPVTGTGGSTGTTGIGGATGAGGGGGSGAGGARATGGASGGGVGGATGMGGATGAGGAIAGTAPFKGVANVSTCADFTTLKTSWYYNWGLTPFANCSAPGFVPMIAGKSEKTAAAVTASLTRITNARYPTLLGFNEPNKVDQSNLTVETAIALWPQVTADPAIRVGSPATSADAPGQAWFTSFMSMATTLNLRVDFVAIHWYGWNAGSCDAKAAQLESYVKWAEAIPGNRPIWITEWGCLNLSNPDIATVQAFYSAAVAMFARHPRIERYAWYPWTTNNELITAGTLTSLGTAFSAAASTK